MIVSDVYYALFLLIKSIRDPPTEDSDFYFYRSIYSFELKDSLLSAFRPIGDSLFKKERSEGGSFYLFKIPNNELFGKVDFIDFILLNNELFG